MQTYDNVIIFGAGASCDAGIPMLSNFVDEMWAYGARGRSPHGPLSDEDKVLLADAHAIRTELERYNSRANFNIRNLEDVLSLLWLESLAGNGADGKYRTWIKAIARVIELACVHRHPAEYDPRPATRNAHYLWFWNSILGAQSKGRVPALVTFNYDLVFERTLLEYYHFLPNSELQPREHSCQLRYFFKPFDFGIQSKEATYRFPVPGSRPAQDETRTGFRAEASVRLEGGIEIPYLKLHGSLNWCNETVTIQNSPGRHELTPRSLPVQVADTPLILPPIFNKMNSRDVAQVWEKALAILRETKHIIIVGYSLPKTDIYMQYFLKSAVGPNSNLQRIIVFDPVLFCDNERTREMESRYKDCFSSHFSDRITFRPATAPGVEVHHPPQGLGTFFHFVQALKHDATKLFFTP